MHHQMCFPFNMSKEDYRIIGWAENVSGHYDDVDGTQMEVPVEPELMYFPKINGLGSQFHPEGMDEGDPALVYCQELLDKFMDDKL